MVLENASAAPTDDPYSTADPYPTDSSSTDPYSTPTTTYPPPPPLAPLSFLIYYNETDRQRYLRTQLALQQSQLGIRLTPTEKTALDHYNAVFYSYESYGDVFGLSAGLLLAFMLRNRKPGAFVNTLCRPFPVDQNAKLWLARGIRFTILGAVGRMYGLTTAGYQALLKIREEQQRDPNLKRYNEVRLAWQNRREEMIRSGARPPPVPVVDRRDLGTIEALTKQAEGGEDEQSLGGLAATEGTDVPEETTTGAEYNYSYTSPQSLRKESAWDRLRKGARRHTEETVEETEADTTPVDTSPSSSSPWPTRAPMAGYEKRREPRTDNFTFSPTEEERQLAREEAQKAFDERVERERSGFVDEFVADVADFEDGTRGSGAWGRRR
ncbi:hypothetical protein RUND412_000378 [Rhizina undulata]